MRRATAGRGRTGPATPRGPAPGERGSATAELAVALPAVVLLLLAGLTSVGAVTARLQCVDAAREAALVAARGGSGTEAAARLAPEGAEVTVTVDGDTVVAVVRARVPVLSARLPAVRVEATAVAAVEPGHPGPSP
ncbi:MAG: TadE family type IV pilus minor pilin [Micromonosporaceae bacterium]|jgi:hypothetical protein